MRIIFYSCPYYKSNKIDIYFDARELIRNESDRRPCFFCRRLNLKCAVTVNSFRKMYTMMKQNHFKTFIRRNTSSNGE